MIHGFWGKSTRHVRPNFGACALLANIDINPKERAFRLNLKKQYVLKNKVGKSQINNLLFIFWIIQDFLSFSPKYQLLYIDPIGTEITNFFLGARLLHGYPTQLPTSNLGSEWRLQLGYITQLPTSNLYRGWWLVHGYPTQLPTLDIG